MLDLRCGRVAADRELVDPERLGGLAVGDHHGVGLVVGALDDRVLEAVDGHVDDVLAELPGALRESRGRRRRALRALDDVADEAVEARARDVELDLDAAVVVLGGRAHALPLRAVEPLQLVLAAGLAVLRLTERGARRPARTTDSVTSSSTEETFTGAVTCFSSSPVAAATTRYRHRRLVERRRERVVTVGRGLRLRDLAPPSSNAWSMTGVHRRRRPAVRVNFSPTNGDLLETVGASSPLTAAAER